MDHGVSVDQAVSDLRVHGFLDLLEVADFTIPLAARTYGGLAWIKVPGVTVRVIG